MNNALLYVDDEQINLMLFQINYSDKFQVFTANSASDALQVLRLHPEITLVITDMKMPGMNGVELAYQIKREANKTAVFVLTGYEILPDIENAMSDKVIERYYSKPFDIDGLADDIRTYIC